MDLASISCTEKTRFEENKLNGVLAEIIAIQDFRSNGFQIRRTGTGSDFIAFKETLGEVDQIYVEVKYGQASLSPLQKRQKFLARKHNMGFFEYRVTKEFLENFKKIHGINTENIDAVELRRMKNDAICNQSWFRESNYQAEITHEESKIRIKIPWICPNCKKTKAESETELIEKFGTRKMDDHTIRNQSWCRRCR